MMHKTAHVSICDISYYAIKESNQGLYQDCIFRLFNISWQLQFTEIILLLQVWL